MYNLSFSAMDVRIAGVIQGLSFFLSVVALAVAIWMPWTEV